MLAGGQAHPRDGDARGKGLPAARVGGVERGERRLGTERREDADDVVAPGGRPDAPANGGAGDEARDRADDDLAFELLRISQEGLVPQLAPQSFAPDGMWFDSRLLLESVQQAGAREAGLVQRALSVA